jgi:hypothetical protein
MWHEELLRKGRVLTFSWSSFSAMCQIVCCRVSSSNPALFLALLKETLTMEIIIGVVGVIGGLIGAVLGAWCAVWFPRSANRRQATLQLLERYTSPEFFVARSEAWRIRRTWENGDRSCVWFFISDPNHPYDPDAVAKCSNGLTPHQNLSWLLHFFASSLSGAGKRNI